jgi:cytoskeletal protein RodZ
MRNKNYRRHSTKNRNRKPLYFVVFLIIASALVATLYIKFHHTYKVIPTTPTSVSTNTQNSNTKSQGTTTSQNNSKQTDNATPKNSAELKAPGGTLISNHSPSLSSNSAEVSVCSTSVGATCEIQLTQGSLTQTLPAKLTDNEGNVTWTWDVKTAGLPVGKWRLTAIAKFGSNTLSTSDSLDVQP